MTKPTTLICWLTVLLAALLHTDATAQDSGAGDRRFDAAAGDAERRLEDAIAELSRLREEIATDVIPRSRELSRLEADLADIRREHQRVVRLFDSRSLETTNLGREIKARADEIGYLANLFAEYARNFESRLHISEMQRHTDELAAIRLAAERDPDDAPTNLATELSFLNSSLDRLEDLVGGTRFEGTAVDPNGIVRHGTFVLLGPAALFRSGDGAFVGTAEQRLGSLEPTIVPFIDELDVAATTNLIAQGVGEVPLDPTLGTAHRIAATEETLWEHIQKGGPVMVPIFALAGAALLVALAKMVQFLFVRRPSRRAVRDLMTAIASKDTEAARRHVQRIKGPTGRMLAAGIGQLGHSRELIEEVMYEVVIRTRLSLQRLLPFIAICAAAAPLLGLLGTVTGIIKTFQLITIFGSGDVKTLSGGISQALITTEYGLITAIPALLLHAILSRKAKGLTDEMEIIAMQVVNEITKAQPGSSNGPRPERSTSGLLEPKLDAPTTGSAPARPSAAAPTGAPSSRPEISDAAGGVAVAEPPPSPRPAPPRDSTPKSTGTP